MPPASNSRTLEKIIFRMPSLAFAAVLYSNSPFKSWARKVNTAAASAARMALQAVFKIA